MPSPALRTQSPHSSTALLTGPLEAKAGSAGPMTDTAQPGAESPRKSPVGPGDPGLETYTYQVQGPPWKCLNK